MNVRGFDLTYCSNIHAGETWAEVQGALTRALPSIRQHLGASGPLAIGLRLSAQAARQLEQPDAFKKFQSFLGEGDYYVPTINGFPYGAFHRERVKENVYLPDWRDRARIEYSNRLATVLAGLMAGGSQDRGSVSTVPGAFKGHLRSADDASAIARGVLEHARHLVDLADRTGVAIVLAIEPEPACFIETTAEAVDFFTRHLFDGAVTRAHGLTVDQVRRHVGVCFDACHMAVEFEDHEAALTSLDRAGIQVPKFQISSALVVRDQTGRDALQRFVEDTYLHQVVECRDGSLTRHVDLPDAFSHGGGGEWRVHFHVPVFLRSLGTLETTQPDLERVLDLIKLRSDRPCLEVETYTWDVLPAEHRTVEMSEAIARELAWARDRLKQ